MAVDSGVVVSPDAEATRAREVSEMRCDSAWRERRAVSMSATAASISKCLGARRAETLVPPTSAWSGSSRSAGAMWYAGSASVVASAARTVLSSAVLSLACASEAAVSAAAVACVAAVEVSVAAVDCAACSGAEPPPHAARLARRTTERARAGVAFRARARRFKADPSMSWFIAFSG